jgi:hypothetical protein
MNPSTPVIEKQRSAIGATDHSGEIFPDDPGQASGFSSGRCFFGHPLQKRNSRWPASD